MTGLGALWIVTKATPTSTLGDVLSRATPRELALQVRGGLDPDEIIGWFDNHSEANQIALQELHRAGVDTSQQMVAVHPSDVAFNTQPYERDHGARPRGQGHWGFVDARYSWSVNVNYLDYVKWFDGSYGDAKRQAARAFAAEGVTDVVVCS
jgi:hypothetical protein